MYCFYFYLSIRMCCLLIIIALICQKRCHFKCFFFLFPKTSAPTSEITSSVLWDITQCSPKVGNFRRSTRHYFPEDRRTLFIPTAVKSLNPTQLNRGCDIYPIFVVASEDTPKRYAIFRAVFEVKSLVLSRNTCIVSLRCTNIS